MNEELLEEFCDKYCKYPDLYNPLTWECELSESEICKNCPITKMIKGAEHNGPIHN